MKLIPYLLVLGLWIASADTSKAQTEIPALQQRVTDFTNTLSYSDWKDLESRLKRFEDSTSTQIAILMINSLEGASIEEYSMRVFEKNKLGQKGKDNGVLILVAKTDRKVRIDVGYGLEGVLTDALNSQIVTRQICESLRLGISMAGSSQVLRRLWRRRRENTKLMVWEESHRRPLWCFSSCFLA